MKKTIFAQSLALLLALLLTLSSCTLSDGPAWGSGSDTTDTTANDVSPWIPPSDEDTEIPALTQPTFELSSIPAYSGSPFVAVNGNIPSFTENQYTATSYEYYSALDGLGRCGAAVACIGIDLMPTEDRGDIGSVKPSGWQSVQYDIVSGKYLYNRCHLIGFQLSGEDANKQNLITGTRYLNVDGMLPFENMIADYVKETENHVLLRVTPIFEGDGLVARGVHMEAYSIEDQGDGICFNVYVYNVQPGIVIDYATGESRLANSDMGDLETDDTAESGENADLGTEKTYILNTSTKKFHDPSCSYADSMSEANKQTYVGDRADLLDQGYEPCGRCDP